jgi:hypothetical protein
LRLSGVFKGWQVVFYLLRQVLFVEYLIVQIQSEIVSHVIVRVHHLPSGFGAVLHLLDLSPGLLAPPVGLNFNSSVHGIIVSLYGLEFVCIIGVDAATGVAHVLLILINN